MGNAAPDQLSVADATSLLGALIDDFSAVAHGRLGGLEFVYRSLSRLRDHWHLRDVMAVVDDPAVGRQVFRADRRPLDPGWQRDVALHSGAGIYTDPTLVEVADDLVNAYNLCAAAFRMDWLQYQSMHDVLTGLYNRRGFDEQLEQAVGRSRRYEWAFSLVLIDLNQFKAINDRLGHPGGDAVLRAVGDRLRQNLRAGDVAGRIGGDEFALLLPGGGAEVIPSLLERLHVQVDVADQEPPEIELSVGVASCPEEATSMEALYQLADQRLYESKRR